jgi:hypothetical protein
MPPQIDTTPVFFCDRQMFNKIAHAGDRPAAGRTVLEEPRRGMRARAAAYDHEMPRPYGPSVLLVLALACGGAPVSVEPAAQPVPAAASMPDAAAYDAALMNAPDAADGATQIPLDAQTWRAHPAIAAVRALVEVVDRAIAQKKLRVVRRQYDCLPGESARSAFLDDAGRVRKLVRSVGSEDSAITVEQYFDESGQLRFAFFVAGAVNDSTAHVRMYLDPGGHAMWTQRDATGPGYTWVFTPLLFPRAPANAFQPPALCP